MVYDTKDKLLKTGEMDAELKSFLDQNPLPPADFSRIEPYLEAAKQRLAVTKTALGDVPDNMTAEELTYTTSDRTRLRALLFKPRTLPEDGSPLVVMYHGGGFCVGFPESEEQTARNLVQSFGVICVSMQYRLAPQFPFPYAIEDSWTALQWAASNATSWGADPSKGFIIGGTSAGGNITAVLAHLARDNDLSPPLTGQYLAIPAICPVEVLPEKYQKYMFSWEQNAHAPILPVAACDMFMSAYKPDMTDARYAVLNHPDGHQNLPRAFFQIAGLDPLRDEAIIYERVLREENHIKTKMLIYDGLPHGFWSFLPMLKSSQKFRREQVEGFGWLLGKLPMKIEATTTAGSA